MARKRELELEVMRLQLQLDISQRDTSKMAEDVMAVSGQKNELEWQLRAANDQIKDLQEQIVKLDKDKAVLLERLDLAGRMMERGTQPPHQAYMGGLPQGHEPEEIEDARYALQTQRITNGEFREILEQYGYTNTEVAIDGGELPQIQ